MTLLEAIILGIIQGATEFLPVSSSGHSYLIPEIFGLTTPNLAEVAIAHQGTLLAVFIYFWRDIWGIIKGVLGGLAEGKPFGNANARLGWYIVAGTIPAAIAGLTLEDWFDEKFGNATAAACFLLVTAAFLVIGERMLNSQKTSSKIKLSKMNWLDAIIIGLFQMVALFPGVSRSGSTMMGGLMRGLNRELAARYSFLLSIPVILGAGLLGIKDLMETGNIDWAVLGTLFVTSAVVGYACIAFLLNWVKQRSLYPFAIYCAIFGLGYLIITQFIS